MQASKINKLYEINTVTYLDKLSRKTGTTINLASIPDDELRKIAEFGFDAVWLMGIWQRSPVATTMAKNEPSLIEEAKNLLPDFSYDDMVGSAYSIKSYQVNEAFGGESALLALRERLKSFNLKLILDIVPNHSAIDANWLDENPEYYVEATPEQAAEHPNWYFQKGQKFLALGRDPNFDAWSDVAQLNAFSPAYRDASIETLTHIGTLADGVRCDMAMLMMSEIFAKTWSGFVEQTPETEYWTDVTSKVRQQLPDFIFIAESYWESQNKLISQGFDYCYNKDLYDEFVAGSAESIIKTLRAHQIISANLLNFLENHDEPRAAFSMPKGREQAAAFIMSALPGPSLFYEGQIDGYPYKIPVQLGREPDFAGDDNLRNFYAELFKQDRMILSWITSSNNSNLLLGITTDNLTDQDKYTVHALVNFSDQTTSMSLPNQLLNAKFHLIDNQEITPVSGTLTIVPWQIIIANYSTPPALNIC